MTTHSAMVRKKRKGVIKEKHATSAVIPSGVDLHQELKVVPVNVALPASFSHDDLIAWYEALCAAQGSLYEQLKILQLFRAQCRVLVALEESDYHIIAASIWRLVFRLSVAPSARPLRKNLGLILDVLTQSKESELNELQIVAAQELRAYLGALWTELDGPNQTPEARVGLLDCMLHLVESPFVARILVENPSAKTSFGDAEHLLRFVTCCANQLEALGAPIRAFHETSIKNEGKKVTYKDDEAAAASTNVVLVASDRCSYALKSVIILATMKEVLDCRLNQCDRTCVDGLTVAFSRILENCVLLLQTSVVHKDLLTQAGLAFCLVLRVLLQLSASSSSEVTKLLVQTVHPELSIIHCDACNDVQLRAYLKVDNTRFSGLSRLALYRGLLNSLTNDDLIRSARALGLNELNQSLLDAIFMEVKHFCDQELYNTRLFAFQVVEAFLRRAAMILQQQQKELKRCGQQCPLLAVETLTNLTTAVLLNWEHPSKKVNQFMALVFEHMVNYFILCGKFKDWNDAILPRLVELPPTSRAKYGSLTILVGQTGARPVLQASPKLLSSLLFAVGQKDYAAPAAANLFAQILDDLSQSDDNINGVKKLTSTDECVTAWRQLWLPDVMQVILSPDANLRSRVAMYVIPLLLKKDPDCVPVLIQRLQLKGTEGNAEEHDADVALWAELEVLKFARKKIAPEKLVGVSMKAIECGLCHANGETRTSAFDALCASLKSTSMPPDDELRLVKIYLVVNGKEIDPSCRMNTLLGLKTVLIRIKETIRLATKNADNPISQFVPSFVRDEFAAAVSFKRWIELFVVTSVYPGALPQRLKLGLEVLLLYVQLFGLNYHENKQSSRNLLCSKQMVTALLNMLMSAWDSIRSLAYTILDLYPEKLPGYSTRTELSALIDWAVGLCGSPRQRESDAGAMFIRLLFQKCSAAIQRFKLTFQNSSELEDGATETLSDNPDVAFVLQLTHVIVSRIKAFSLADIRHGESPLVHGFLLSLRYVLDSVAYDRLSKNEAADWPRALTQVFTVIHQSMRASLAVVGDANSGIGDEELSASFASVLGEVSAVAKTSNSALRIDCRGHLIVEYDNCSLDRENEDGYAEQRSVVGSWLAARECGAILELLMRRVPLPSPNSAPDTISFFTVEMAQLGGETLLNSLFELKHKGAVAMAYQAFEGVCRAFLANSEQNPVLGDLPPRWADRLLKRLERSEQHFILRRSSGFAFCFLAILRAEPRNSAAVILPKVMLTLLRLAGQDTDAAEKRNIQLEHHLMWRARVHALNILRLICQDAVLAEDVARYVVDMFELAVRGFDCGSWAVRNSSMMLFAAATQRAIGDKRIADGGRLQQVSCDDVFSRFQHLRGFLARELTRLLANDSKLSNALDGIAPPGLYPLLLFLSRLRPGDADNQRVAGASHLSCDGDSELASFVPLVLQCASQPTMAIRHMAAKVVASIVSERNAASVLSTLCSELPQGVCSIRKQFAFKSNNYVHGVLTQIRHLVSKYLGFKGAQSTIYFKNAQAEVFKTAVSKLLSSTMWLWVGSAADQINPFIRAELIATMDMIMRFYGGDVSGALKLLASEAMKEVFIQTTEIVQAEVERQLLQRCDMSWDAAVLLSTRPGIYVLDRAMVKMWFSLWTDFASNQSWTVLKKMITSNVLQIRKKATKQVANKLILANVTTDAVAELKTLLNNQLLTETHPIVRAHQLQFLARFELQQKVVDAPAQRAQLQTQLVRTLSTSADPHVLAPALKLLAFFTSHLLSSRVVTEHEALFRSLCQEIELRSDENQPLILRQAAASALHHSRFLLLIKKQDTINDVALAGWMSAIRLLQDDSVHVRANARQAVLDALAEDIKDPKTANFYSRASLSDATVLPLAVEFIAASFDTEDGIQSLSKVLIQLIDAPSVLTAYFGAAGAKAQDWDNLYRQIFETESSNFFAERDTLVQNLVHALFVRTFHDNASMRRLRYQILTDVVRALTILNQEAHTGNEWLGGITYHSDVFGPLFGLLTAAVAITTSSLCPISVKLQSLAGRVCELAHEAYTMFSKDEATHPLVIRALELLACSATSSTHTSNDPVRELLYLTPYWAALTES